MTAAEEKPSPSLMPLSPFPPIADYAFLSDCHTGALVAPDGSIDWLCVPRFDAASVFGTLLDRGAGSSGSGRSASTSRRRARTSRGRTSSSTTWHTTTGWVVVRDALVMGPRQQEDTVTPHTRPPADEDAEHLLVRTVECIEGSVELELVCEPVFDYGRTPADWSLVGDDRHTADATGAGTTIRLQTDLSVGIEGNRVRARHVLRKGERAYCSLSWAEALASPADVDEADAAIARDDDASGASGSIGRGCPTTAGASRSSARRWRSRA